MQKNLNNFLFNFNFSFLILLILSIAFIFINFFEFEFLIQLMNKEKVVFLKNIGLLLFLNFLTLLSIGNFRS